MWFIETDIKTYYKDLTLYWVCISNQLLTNWVINNKCIIKHCWLKWLRISFDYTFVHLVLSSAYEYDHLSRLKKKRKERRSLGVEVHMTSSSAQSCADETIYPRKHHGSVMPSESNDTYPCADPENFQRWSAVKNRQCDIQGTLRTFLAKVFTSYFYIWYSQYSHIKFPDPQQ